MSEGNGKLDVLSKPSDSYLSERCGVCGQPWEGFHYTDKAGVEKWVPPHPPSALHMILTPQAQRAREVRHERRKRREESQGLPPLCHVSLPLHELAREGIVHTLCAMHRPTSPALDAPTLVILANKPCASVGGLGAVKRYPNEVCPPSHLRKTHDKV